MLLCSKLVAVTVIRHRCVNDSSDFCSIACASNQAVFFARLCAFNMVYCVPAAMRLKKRKRTSQAGITA